MKKYLCVLLTFVLILGLAACTATSTTVPTTGSQSETSKSESTATTGAETTKKDVMIAFANLDDKIEFCQSVKKGIIEEAEKKGWTVNAMDNAFDGTKAIANANNVVSLKADVFLEFNPDSQAGQSIMDIINEAKIPTIAIDIPLPEVPYFGASNFGAGKVGGVTAGEIAKKAWDSFDYVVVITRPDGGELIKQREDGFFEGVASIMGEIPADKKIILDGKGDVLPSQQAFTDFLTAHPNATHIIVGSVNDQCAQGALAAAEIAARDSSVIMVSQGCDISAINNLYLENENCWKGSVSYAPENYGKYLIPLCEKLLNGEEIPAENFLEHFTITRENIAQYYDKP